MKLIQGGGEKLKENKRRRIPWRAMWLAPLLLCLSVARPAVWPAAAENAVLQFDIDKAALTKGESCIVSVSLPRSRELAGRITSLCGRIEWDSGCLELIGVEPVVSGPEGLLTLYPEAGDPGAKAAAFLYCDEEYGAGQAYSDYLAAAKSVLFRLTFRARNDLPDFDRVFGWQWDSQNTLMEKNTGVSLLVKTPSGTGVQTIAPESSEETNVGTEPIRETTVPVLSGVSEEGSRPEETSAGLSAGRIVFWCGLSVAASGLGYGGYRLYMGIWKKATLKDASADETDAFESDESSEGDDRT